jgi:hypothetical protein
MINRFLLVYITILSVGYAAVWLAGFQTWVPVTIGVSLVCLWAMLHYANPQLRRSEIILAVCLSIVWPVLLILVMLFAWGQWRNLRARRNNRLTP